MMYCNLEEAWGDRHISRYYQPPSHQIIKPTKQIEAFTVESPEADTSSSSIECKKLNKKMLKHIRNCPKCRRKLRYIVSPPIVETIKDAIDSYKDIIILVLLGITIMVFLNLVMSVVRLERKS